MLVRSMMEVIMYAVCVNHVNLPSLLQQGDGQRHLLLKLDNCWVRITPLANGSFAFFSPRLDVALSEDAKEGGSEKEHSGCHVEHQSPLLLTALKPQLIGFREIEETSSKDDNQPLVSTIP